MNNSSPLLSLSEFRVPRGDRLFIVGTTGSGKTKLSERLVPMLGRYLLVHDGKGRIEWPGFHRHEQLHTLMSDRYPWLLYRPTHDAVHNPDAAEPFYEFAYRRGETVVYTDEVRTIAKGDVWPVWYHACQTRGRELGVTMVNGTQRPSRIPLELLSESESIIAFRLNLDRDRQRIEEVTGINPEVLTGRALPKHYFWHTWIGEDPRGPFHLHLDAASTAGREAE